MQKGQKVYTNKQGIHFRKSPDTSNDANIIRDLDWGEEALLTDEPWLKVKIGTQEGWIRSDKTTETAPVQPLSMPQVVRFVIGQTNLADNPNTIEVRKIINDEFGGGLNKWNLQCTEYTQYRVKTKLGITIQWPVKSGRNGGKWWKIFQDAGLYKIVSEPKAGCAICFTAGLSSDLKINEIGHVAFVEEVLPDGSVRVSEANWPPPGQQPQGQYNKRIIPKEKWQNQYKAQFVDFS